MGKRFSNQPTPQPRNYNPGGSDATIVRLQDGHVPFSVDRNCTPISGGDSYDYSSYPPDGMVPEE